ncbi:MAG: NUDIX domain-containing protein [Chloroflexota bacterium]|jgi:ADP-ribose pyrophosphatase YjhB (NUDIX family)
MTMIYCYDRNGKAVMVPSDAVVFRPAAYGILIENEQILLATDNHTGLWHPPGHILEPHETPTQALKHYLRHIAGLTPLIGPLLFVEDQYRVDEKEQAWHLSLLYYALDRPSYSTITLGEMETSEAQWVRLSELKRPKLQFGYEAIQAARLRLKL